MKKIIFGSLFSVSLFFISCSSPSDLDSSKTQPVYQDTPYLQDLSIKYFTGNSEVKLTKAFMDRNGVVQVMSSDGILRTHDGQFLYAGSLVKDRTYRPLTDKKITDLAMYQNQFIYLDDRSVLSNAWAGKLFIRHGLDDANLLAVGNDFEFLVGDGKSLVFLSNNQVAWQGLMNGDKTIDLRFDNSSNMFWALGTGSLSTFDPRNRELKKIFSGNFL